jgi:hypothetical protein
MSEIVALPPEKATKPRGPRRKVKRPWQGLMKSPALTGEPKLSVVLLV